MQDEDMQKRWAAFRQQEERYQAEARRRALPIPDGVALMGSFAEDDPEVHETFRQEASEARPDPENGFDPAAPGTGDDIP